MSRYAVELDGVTVRFGSRTAVQDVSLQVEPATFLALIGPNAGGKTTLMRVMLGMIKPTAGTVRIFGAPLAQLGNRRARIGYVPQASAVNPRYPASTRQVVSMGAIPRAGLLRLPRPDTRARVDAMLKRVGLEAEADANFHTLSGGQQQRAIIARALVPGPELLLLDEPTGGIDTTGQTQVLDLLRELHTDPQLSIVMVSHHIGELMPYVDRVACLNTTLHWHDRAQLLNEAVLREVYACELDAYFLRHHEHQAEFHGSHGHDTHDHD